MRTSAGRRRQTDKKSPAAMWIMLALGLGLVTFLVAWLLGWVRFSTDPRVLEIRTMQEEARQTFLATGGPKTLAEATAAVAAMGAIRGKIDSLPEHLRSQAERGSGSLMRSAFRARIDGYFALPPEKRQAELDRQIQQDELLSKAFEAANAVAGMLGGGGGGPGTGGGGGGPPGGGPRSRTEEDRNRWRKQMIDRTSPDQRARYVEYRNAMDKRREQLGLPPRGPR